MFLLASSGKLLGKFGGYQLLEAVLRNRKRRQASKKVRRLYHRRFFGAAFSFAFRHGFAPRSKLPSKRVSLPAMPPLRDALRMRGPETDWADRRGWLSKSELLRISQQLGKMSCFSVFSNFAESQKELKTPFEIPFPFFIFPVLPGWDETG